MSSVPVSWPMSVDGVRVEPGLPALAADDEGFLLGLAVFDTLAVRSGGIVGLESHLARLQGGARAMGIEVPEVEVLTAAVDGILAALGERSAALRITLSPGRAGGPSRLVVTTRALPSPPAEGVSVVIAERAIIADDPLQAVKSSSRARNVLHRRAAQARGAYDALLGTQEGDLSEGTVANLFLVQGGELRTPPLDRGVLGGVTRGRLLELAAGLEVPAREVRIDAGDLARCDEAFLCNSLVGVLPILEVQGVRQGLPSGGGPVTRALSRALAGARG